MKVFPINNIRRFSSLNWQPFVQEEFWFELLLLITEFNKAPSFYWATSVCIDKSFSSFHRSKHHICSNRFISVSWFVIFERTNIFLNILAELLNTFIIARTIILILFLSSLFPHLVLHIDIYIEKEFHFAKRLHSKVNVDNFLVFLRLAKLLLDVWLFYYNLL